MNLKSKFAGIFLGLFLASTSVFAANGSCGAGKCGGEMKKEMEMKKSSSCGTGKCGANMNEAKTPSCGAGKCGGAMKNDMSKMADEMKNTKASCGSGKCGSK